MVDCKVIRHGNPEHKEVKLKGPKCELQGPYIPTGGGYATDYI